MSLIVDLLSGLIARRKTSTIAVQNINILVNN